MRNARFRSFLAVMVLIAIGSFLAWRSNKPAVEAKAAPTRVDQTDAEETDKLTMSDVLEMAVAAREHMAENLDDYSARFVKQEVDTNGVLGEETEMFLKIQTRLRGDSEDAPMRVYMRFEEPESIRGREVIWGQDLYDGKMAVHEVGLLLSLKTIWLDPEGVIAMQGQRYPISEIGLVKLVEKLIERGEMDRDNPDVSVTLTNDYKLDDVATQLIQVRKSKPGGEEGDFSLAEIVIDPDRQLVLSYRSFGWPDEAGGEPPLMETYTYHDVQTNIGLSESDFDPKNPEYAYPAF